MKLCLLVIPTQWVSYFCRKFEYKMFERLLFLCDYIIKECMEMTMKGKLVPIGTDYGNDREVIFLGKLSVDFFLPVSLLVINEKKI